MERESCSSLLTKLLRLISKFCTDLEFVGNASNGNIVFPPAVFVALFDINYSWY